MVEDAFRSLLSRSRVGGYEGIPKTIIMPPYHEMAIIGNIPSASSTAATVEFTRTNAQESSQKEQLELQDEEDVMSISREELDAKLAQNKAEVSAVAAEMRREMSEWRVQQTEIMMKLQSEVSAINVKLDERFEAQKRSSSLIQWLVGIVLAFVALIPAFQSMFDTNTRLEKNAPIVIQVPQTQTTTPPQPK
ncbi:TPA: hypothetical protein N5K95_000386 [Enterobacter roggenkampii]|nr:hypothetical protein [Enterobacter roggenkampii]